ncbi:MAG: cytochrome b/b6 domain-containing protein [Ferruginibacter sp.]|nr:cytochrome b/b6 domain-containing protein [Ferruginibacter sp.]
MPTVSTNQEVTFFRTAKPASIRIWHWLTFLFFAVTVTTVILASTLFTIKDNISMVQDQVHEKGGIVTRDQARNVAHEYSDKLWNLHKYSGYALSFLILSRIIIEIRLSKEKKLAAKIRSALGFPAVTTERKHFLFVQYSYAIFYILFIVMATTGLILAFEDTEWLKPVQNIAKETHSIVQYALYTYFVIHIVGVIRADLTKYSGIVSRMINGKESN